MPLTKTTGQPLDPKEQAKRYENIPNARGMIDDIKTDEGPVFHSLGDLKSIFKPTVEVSLPLPDGSTMTFHVKKVDPGTLFLTNRTLIFLLKSEMDNNELEAEKMSTMDMLSSLDAEKIKEYEDALAGDLKTKQDLILCNVISPTIDREFLELLSPESIDVLFHAIASSLQQAQPLLQTFILNQKVKDSEVLLHKVYLICDKTGNRPSEILFPDIDCATTSLAIDIFVFDVGYYLEEEKRLKELELQITAGMGAKATKSLVGI